MTSQESVSNILMKLPQWSTQEVQDQLSAILPILISSLSCEDQKAVSLQAVEALLASCLPCLPINTVENQLLQHVLPVTEALFMEAIEGINVTLQDAENMTEEDVEFAVTSLLQVCLELLSHLDLTLHYIESHGQVKVTDVPSIPKTILTTLLESFKHCRESESLYGSMFHSVNEPLSSFFYKCTEIQKHFFVVMKCNLNFNCTYEEEFILLIEVLQLLGCIGEKVIGLGLQILAFTWKGYVTFVEQNSDQLKTRLDVASPLRCLANAVTSHLHTIVDAVNMDSQLAMWMLKVAAFELKVIVKLCRIYAGYLGDCFNELVQLLIILHRYSHPCLQFRKDTKVIAENIEKHVTIGAEPLLIPLISEQAFTQVYFSIASKIPKQDDEHLGILLLTVNVVKRLLHSDHATRKLWMNTEVNLLDVIFKTLDYCHTELYSELHFPGIMIHGEPPRSIDLYEVLLFHVSGFIVLASTSEFNIIEKILLENVLQPSIWRALLVMDIWCVVARHGSAELCFQHVSFLVSILRSFSPAYCCPEKSYLQILIRRLFPLMLSKHQNQMFETLPPAEHMDIYKELDLKCIPTNSVSNIIVKSIKSTSLSIMEFINGPGSLEVYDKMVSALYCTAEVLNLGQDVAVAELTDNVMSLWECVPADIEAEETSIEGSQWLNNFVCAVCGITAALVSTMKNVHLLKVLYKLEVLARSGSSNLKMNVIAILKALASKVVENTSDSLNVFNSISIIFTIVLQDTNPIVYQSAFEVFAYFAHITKHEQIVRLSASSSKHLQKQITQYLTKVPTDFVHECSIDNFKYEKPAKFTHKCKQKLRKHNEKLNIVSPTVTTFSLDSCTNEKYFAIEIDEAIAQLQKDSKHIIKLCEQCHLTVEARQELTLVIKQLNSLT